MEWLEEKYRREKEPQVAASQQRRVTVKKIKPQRHKMAPRLNRSSQNDD